MDSKVKTLYNRQDLVFNPPYNPVYRCCLWRNVIDSYVLQNLSAF